MPDRYWVGGTGTWDSTNTANWSATSGGAGGASVPSALDDVYFNSASSASSYTVTLSFNVIRCRNFTANGPASGTVTFSSGNLTCAGNFFLAATGVSYSSSGVLTLTGLSGATVITITANNNTLPGQLNFTNSSIKYELGSAITLTQTASDCLSFTSNTCFLDTNGYTITATSFRQTSGRINFRDSNIVINGANSAFSNGTSSPQFMGFPSITFVDTGRTNTQFTVNTLSSTTGNYIKTITVSGTGTNTTLQISSFTIIQDLLSTKTNAFTVRLVSGCFIRKFGISGSSGNLVTLTSTSGTANLTLFEPTAVDFLTVSNINIQTGGVFPFYVGANSTVATSTNVIAAVIPAVTPRYWVGGTGNWDATATTNWSATSGGAGGASVPNSFNDVIFDAASSGADYTVTVTAMATCRSLTLGAPASGNLTYAGSQGLVISGNMTIAAAGVIRSHTGFLSFLSASPSTLTTNGVNLANILNINSYGGKLTLGSAIINSNRLSLNGGEFDTAGYAATFSDIARPTVSGATLTLGASTVTLTATATPISLAEPNAGTQNNMPTPSFILNAGTSTISVSASNMTNIGNNGLAWYNYVYSYTGTGNNVAIPFGASFNNLTYNSSVGAGALQVRLQANSTTVITGTLTLNGVNEFSRLLVLPALQISGQTTITANLSIGGASVSFVSFRGINVTGATISGTSLGDESGNSGIVFPAAKTVYWVGGTANFYSANWSLTSGGSTSAANFPLGQDTVIVDNAGLAAGASINFTSNSCVSVLDMSGKTTASTFSSSPSVLTSFTGGSGVTFTNGIAFTGYGTNCLFNQNGATLSGFSNAANSAKITLANNLTTTVTAGFANLSTLALNGYTATYESITFSDRTTIDFTGGGTLTSLGASASAPITLVAGTLNVIGNSDVRLTYSGAAARQISFIGFEKSETSAVNLTISGGSYALTYNGFVSPNTIGGVRNLVFTGYTGALSWQSGIVYGNLTYASGMSVTSSVNTMNFEGTSTQTILSNGVTTNVPVTSSGANVVLAAAFTIGSLRTFTLNSGTLNLNGFTLTVPVFSSSNSVVRSIAFGSGNITVNGTTGSSLTVWDTGTVTNFSRTGTPTINISGTSAAGTSITVTTGAMTEAQALDFNYTAGAYSLTESTNPSIYRSLNINGYSGTFQGNPRTLFGGFNAGTTATLSTGSAQVFAATSGTWDITSNGRTLNFGMTFNGAGGTWRLQGATVVAASLTTTLTAGTLDLNGFTYTTGLFSSSNSNVRSIAFGTGQISLSGNAATIWDTATVSNLSFTGTFRVVATYTGGTGTRTFNTGSLSQANAQPLSTTGGSGFILDTSSTDTKALSGNWGNFDLTGVTGTLSNTARTIFGNFNAGSTVTLTAGTNATTFASTSGIRTITTNGRTLDFPLTFNGVGGTWQLQDALISGSTRTSTLTAGALDLNGFTYTTGLFSSSGSTARTIAFGTGQISLSGNAATIWDNSTATNFSFTGTFKVVATYTGATGTRTLNQGFVSEATVQSISTSGSSGFILDTSSTDAKSLIGSWNNFDMTGVTGTLSNNLRTIYGNFNAGSTVTLTAGANATTFAATFGVDTITTNGRTLDFPLTFNGVGGTWQLQDALTVGASRAITLTNGTFDANNFNVTTGTMSSSNSNVRTLALGSGLWTVVGTGLSAWDFSTSTNATITGTATISMTGATAKTFAGGGRTWPTLNQGGAGALTITGSNTFANITSTQTSTSACTITLPVGGTQTLTNLTASGTSSTNLLTFNSSINGTRTNLVVNNNVDLSFTSLRDNSVSGGFTYLARYTNGNVNAGNNLGWDYGAIPPNFLIFF